MSRVVERTQNNLVELIVVYELQGDRSLLPLVRVRRGPGYLQLVAPGRHRDAPKLVNAIAQLWDFEFRTMVKHSKWYVRTSASSAQPRDFLWEVDTITIGEL